MLFNSMVFLWIFIPISILLYFMVDDKYKNLILVFLSIIFYAWGEPTYVVLLVASVVINYILTILMDKQIEKNKRKVYFIIAIILNIGILVYYKYFNFLVHNIQNIFSLDISEVKKVPLPLGISFYVFSSISYIFDIYRKECKAQKNIINMALFITFFPKLLMGPIERYKDFESCIDVKSRKITINSFKDGIVRFVYGLGKKVLIADVVARVADLAFDSNISNLNSQLAWLGAMCYMIQIYFDFSGYSDMAIGIAKMFGFDLMENFNLPYTSQSITEFWRRWHISLGNWFKNYLYIPLGGNRKGKLRTYVNLFIVFIATGVWHGAAWNYIAWGIYNGIFMVIERIKLKELIEKNSIKLINHIYAMSVTFIGWIIFRANGLKNALKYIKTLFIDSKGSQLQTYNILNNRTIITMIIAVLLTGILQLLFSKMNKDNKLSKIYRVIEPVCVGVILIISIMSIVNNTYTSFVYFKF